MNMKSVNKTVNKLLTNKYVLYATLFFAITNVLGYFSLQDFESITLFVLVGFLTSYFSKNMIIILLTAMITTNFLLGAKVTKEFMAGMGLQKTTLASSKIPKETITGVELKNKKKALFENMSNMKGGDSEDDAAVGGDSDINYDKSIKESYEHLDKLIGGEGMNNLTKDTMQLMDRQKQLAESMKTLEPMLNNAKDMLKGFDMKNIEGLSKMVKSLGHGMGATE